MTSLLARITHCVGFVSETRAPFNTDGARHVTGKFEREVSEIQHLWLTPAIKLSDLPAYWDALINQNTVGLDDRKLLLEKVLVLMARFQHSDLSLKIQQFLIGLLYKDLPHPPGSYLSAPNSLGATLQSDNHLKYAFRAADGSNYNPMFPSFGRAGSPYARSVPALRPVPKHILPDSGLVFDTLLCRESFVPHPGGMSSLFFAFATLIIHSIFSTNHRDSTVNDASSYVDLSILYGRSDSQVDQVRRKDGTGRLWEDVFADSRLLFMPPASAALLVLLCRNHNFIAQKLLDINENGTFISPPPVDEKARLVQDDEIFHRSRMVNCGFFAQIILRDYAGAILGLARDQSDWRLDPLMSMRESDHGVSPRGQGNVVSVEFNLLYRWHPTLSVQDTEWAETLFTELFEGKDLRTVNLDDFKTAAHKYMIPPDDVRTWTFNSLVRGTDGRFNDGDLAKILQDATESRAGAFRARGTPEVLRIIEILAIEQGRAWGTCSLNEFRRFLGLKPYRTFEEWNPDKTIHTAAAGLYGDIENLELHVGLQAEDTKDPGPGAGLCPGYTISRAILADAVCLTRGDRFLTTDFTPLNLTSWGYNDCQCDKTDGSFGGMLNKLLFQTLADHYPARSAYAHFAFLDPVYMNECFSKDSNLVQKYIWTRPGPPRATVVVENFEGVKQILSDTHFIPVYNNRMFEIMVSMRGASMDEDTCKEFVSGRNSVEDLLPFSSSYEDTWAEYFKDKTKALIAEKFVDHIGSQSKYINIVGDVINLLPVHWISEKIVGLPTKTITNKNGAWYEQDVYRMFAAVGHYVFFNFEAADDWHLRESSVDTFGKFFKVTKAHFKHIQHWVSAHDILDHIGIENYDSHKFLKRVIESGRNFTTDELSTHVLAAVVPTAAQFSQVIAHLVDFYIDDDKWREREEIIALASSYHDKEAVAKIMVYVREALRLNPPVPGVYRTADKDAMIGPIRIEAGTRTFASIINANIDPTVFGTTPTTAAYDRPAAKAGIFGLGEPGAKLLSSSFFESTAPVILGAILGLKNIKRAPGQSGNFASFVEQWHGSSRQLYINTQGKITPFPDSLVIQFD